MVHYYEGDAKEPTAALITKVHSDTCVSLTTFPAFKVPGSAGSVLLKGAGGAAPNYWEWPPYVAPQPTDDVQLGKPGEHWNNPAGDETKGEG